MRATLALYVPVLHAGYLKLLRDYQDETGELYIFGDDLIKEFLFLEPEIRAIGATEMRQAIAALGLFGSVKILTADDMASIKTRPIAIVDDAISNRIAKHFNLKVAERASVFLRWDEANVLTNQDVHYDHISHDPTDLELMRLASEESSRAGDWWRQVGALVARKQQPLFTAHNAHVPTEQEVYTMGDPRDFVAAGSHSEINTVLHAEQGIITRAAREGISLEGCELYVTVFPCPMCAKQVAFSGITKVYFGSGHASLDGESVLKARGIEIILVSQRPTRG